MLFQALEPGRSPGSSLPVTLTARGKTKASPSLSGILLWGRAGPGVSVPGRGCRDQALVCASALRLGDRGE